MLISPKVSVNQRIELLRKALKFNQRTFAPMVGMSPGGYSNLIAEKSFPSRALFLTLYNSHPNVNFDWVIIGRGSMFLDNIPEKLSKPHEAYSKNAKLPAAHGSVNQRIEAIQNTLNYTQRGFSKVLQMSHGGYNNIIADRASPSYSFFMSLYNACPNLNFDWLITGRGNMFFEAAPDVVAVHEESPIYHIKAQPDCEALRRENALLLERINDLKTIIEMLKKA